MSETLTNLKLAVWEATKQTSGSLVRTCWHCEKFLSLKTMQVEHLNGRDWSIRDFSQIQRWHKYLVEVVLGDAVLACGPCNRKHGGSRRYTKVLKSRQGAPKKTKRSSTVCNWEQLELGRVG